MPQVVDTRGLAQIDESRRAQHGSVKFFVSKLLEFLRHGIMIKAKIGKVCAGLRSQFWQALLSGDLERNPALALL